MIVRYTVIDEADEMLQLDWEDQFKKIMSGGGESSFLSRSVVDSVTHFVQMSMRMKIIATSCFPLRSTRNVES